MRFETIYNETFCALRDNPNLRSIDKREELWKRVKQILPQAKFSTVERCIRKIQNTEKFFNDGLEDNRFVYENEYREYFTV